MDSPSTIVDRRALSHAVAHFCIVSTHDRCARDERAAAPGRQRVPESRPSLTRIDTTAVGSLALTLRLNVTVAVDELPPVTVGP